MKLLAKFNLILGLVLGAGLAIGAAVSHQFLQNDAREEVLRQARLMMEAMRSARDYTTKQVKPLLVNQQEHQKSFLPQTVPAFAATENFDYLRARYPDYAYKEAALNPTNLRDRAVDWESGRHQHLSQPSRQAAGTGGGARHAHRAIALPGPPDSGRSAMPGMPQRAASGARGDDPALWIEQRVRLAARRNRGRADCLGADGGAGAHGEPGVSDAGGLSGGGVSGEPDPAGPGAAGTVVRPLRKLSTMADQISVGQMDMPELPAGGKDEIAVLAGSFNRMRRSLDRALKMLGS